VPGGIVGGVVDAVDVPAPPPKRIQLSDAEVHLKRISGPPIQYTAEAIDHEVEGTMVVRCIVTTQGDVHDCRVIRSLPFMDREVIDALDRWRYQPYLVDGQPVEVDYTFKIRLSLPD
jgi:periplasmic protein TonB